MWPLVGVSMSGRPGALSLGTDSVHQHARAASAGGGTLRGLLSPVPPAGRCLQHAESLLQVPAQPRLPREPAGAGPQPAGVHRGGWAVGAAEGSLCGAGGGALEPEEASLSAPGPLAGRICMPPPPTSPSPGLGGEPPCVGLCRTCGSSRGPWRFTWESSTSG